jgi:phosphoglycolate phosphatase-like HAD superfamily hydrolase
MVRAFADEFGTEPTASVEVAGRTDRWVAVELATRHGRPADEPTVRRIHERYLAHLHLELGRDGPGKGILPGVRRLLDALVTRADVHLALLTGNLEAGARAKLEHFDLWRYFPCGAFGDEEGNRQRLFAVALARVETATGWCFDPATTVVVGDTPLDVDVAVSAGARAVGVATGGYDVQALLASGADAALSSFEDLDAALEAFGLPPDRT